MAGDLKCEEKMKRICKQCGVQFTLSEDEISFYQSKNLHLPKRCEQCRRENKESGNRAEQKVRPYQSKNDNKVKQWAAAAVVLVLLVAGIGIFQSGRLFERDRADAVNEVSTEVTTGALTSTDMQTELPSDKQTELPGRTEDFSSDVLQKQSENTQPSITETESADIDESRDDAPEDETAAASAPASVYVYSFRKAEYLQEHFERHGAEFGYASADEYLAGANRVVASPEVLHKLEAEDGDDVYYLESTNEFVIVSTDGYLRTYFKPDDGKAYFDRQ